MINKIKILTGITLIFLFLAGCSHSNFSDSENSAPIIVKKLPDPVFRGSLTLEESLHNRRSIREYSDTSLNLNTLSQLLWATQGITSTIGYRTAPSAGGLYPLEIYIVTGKVNQLAPGIYKYFPDGHELGLVRETDLRDVLCESGLNQLPIKNGAISIIISAVFERCTQKYGDRGIRYTLLEAGHACQNILLQATSLGVGAVPIGAFEDNKVKDLLKMPDNESPLYIVPIGNVR